MLGSRSRSREGCGFQGSSYSGRLVREQSVSLSPYSMLRASCKFSYVLPNPQGRFFFILILYMRKGSQSEVKKSPKATQPGRVHVDIWLQVCSLNPQAQSDLILLMSSVICAVTASEYRATTKARVDVLSTLLGLIKTFIERRNNTIPNSLFFLPKLSCGPALNPE